MNLFSRQGYPVSSVGRSRKHSAHYEIGLNFHFVLALSRRNGWAMYLLLGNPPPLYRFPSAPSLPLFLPLLLPHPPIPNTHLTNVYLQLLHPFHEQFTDQSGARILQQFTFEQKKTRVAEVRRHFLLGSQAPGGSLFSAFVPRRASELNIIVLFWFLYSVLSRLLVRMSALSLWIKH